MLFHDDAIKPFHGWFWPVAGYDCPTHPWQSPNWTPFSDFTWALFPTNSTEVQSEQVLLSNPHASPQAPYLPFVSPSIEWGQIQKEYVWVNNSKSWIWRIQLRVFNQEAGLLSQDSWVDFEGEHKAEGHHWILRVSQTPPEQISPRSYPTVLTAYFKRFAEIKMQTKKRRGWSWNLLNEVMANTHVTQGAKIGTRVAPEPSRVQYKASLSDF